MFKLNVEALEAAQPKDLDASEIDVRLGATWIDKEYIEQFMYELFDTPYRPGRRGSKVCSFTAEWNITNKMLLAITMWQPMLLMVQTVLMLIKFDDSLNLRDVRIYDTITDADGRKTCTK